jgi:hypothetical protein
MMHTTWRFLLDRHDEPDTTDDADQSATDAGADQLGDAGKQALDRMKAEKKAAAADATAAKKALAEAQAKIAEYADRDKTDTEKLAAKAEAAEKLAATATARAVAAEVRALAAAEFADASDAALLGDLTKYAKADGDVDLDAIKTDLAALLTAKPHLKRTAARTGPLPDGSQGRGGNNAPADFRTADKASADAEFAKYGIRPRSYT